MASSRCVLQHLQFVPAVVVLFYDLEWDDPQWTERCGDLASKVDAVRTSLQGRATKIGLVLVQKNAGLPGDQDLDQQQKAHMLCNRLDGSKNGRNHMDSELVIEVSIDPC